MAEPVTKDAAVQERSVTPFELFFDLVFVFAFTTVTAFLAKDPSPETFAQGALILAALWWAWSAYAWLGSSLNLEEGATRIVMCGVMGALLIVGLAESHAFDDTALVFGIAYFVVRTSHIVLYLLAARGDRGLWQAVFRMAQTSVPAAAIILAAAAFPEDVRPWIWLVAIAIDVGGVLRGGGAGWTIAVEHFVERHRLILIIALGESIVAVGIGAEGLDLSASIIGAALLAITVTVTLWWAYFDVASAASERTLASLTGAAQIRAARDAFSYLHYPMIAGVIAVALGFKKTLEHTDDHLQLIVAAALAGGIALYLLALVLFRYRLRRTIGWTRVVATVVMIAIIPLSQEMSALSFLAITTALMVVLVTYETVMSTEARQRFLATGPAPN